MGPGPAHRLGLTPFKVKYLGEIIKKVMWKYFERILLNESAANAVPSKEMYCSALSFILKEFKKEFL